MIRYFYHIKSRLQELYDHFTDGGCLPSVDNKSIMVGLSDFSPFLKKKLIKEDDFQYFFRYVIPLQLVSLSYGSQFLLRNRTVDNIVKRNEYYYDISNTVSNMVRNFSEVLEPKAPPIDWEKVIKES